VTVKEPVDISQICTGFFIVALFFHRYMGDRTPPPFRESAPSPVRRISNILLPLTFAWFRVRPFLLSSTQHIYFYEAETYTLVFGSNFVPCLSLHVRPPVPPHSLAYVAHVDTLPLSPLSREQG
jgi:hypothetical protein